MSLLSLFTYTFLIIKYLQEIMNMFNILFRKNKIKSQTDTEKITEQDMRDAIIRLKLPKVILELFDGTCTDEVITRLGLNDSYTFTKPYAIINLQRFQQDHYLIERFTPLLAYRHGTIYAYDNLLNGFIKYYTELGPKEGNYPVLTWDGIFIRNIYTLWEEKWSEKGDEYYTDEDIIYVGNLLGLKHTKEILDSIILWDKNRNFSTYEGSEKWENKMINQHNARIG